MMLMLTPDAAQVVKGLTEMPAAEGLRISAATQSHDSQGPGLEVELAAGPQPQDTVVEAEGARLFLAPEAAEAMDGKVLDADIEEGAQVRFSMLLPGEEEPGG